jgi:hypothetical protein
MCSHTATAVQNKLPHGTTGSDWIASSPCGSITKPHAQHLRTLQASARGSNPATPGQLLVQLDHCNQRKRETHAQADHWGLAACRLGNSKQPGAAEAAQAPYQSQCNQQHICWANAAAMQPCRPTVALSVLPQNNSSSTTRWHQHHRILGNKQIQGPARQLNTGNAHRSLSPHGVSSALPGNALPIQAAGHSCMLPLLQALAATSDAAASQAAPGRQ